MGNQPQLAFDLPSSKSHKKNIEDCLYCQEEKKMFRFFCQSVSKHVIEDNLEKMSRLKEKKVEFRKKLLRWYRTHRRNLPWRQTEDSYKIWISEIMLQQTTVAAVIPYYERWMRLFPDIETLSQASLQKILKAWEGLGYYQRAKNLHKAAQIVCKEYQGHIPSDYGRLIRLPGLGPYTTSALLSFAHNLPYSVVEANVRRVLMRLIRFKGQPPEDDFFSSLLKPLIPLKNPGQFNQAMMELGALVCKPRHPLCLLCPVTEFCQAYETGEQEIIPPPKKRSTQKIEAVIAIVRRDRRYLIQKRPSRGLLADLWEFPGGKRKPSESCLHALRREIYEELGVKVIESKFLTKVRHAYTQYQVTLYAYECRLEAVPRLEKGRHRWLTLRGLRRFPFPSGSAKIVRFLEAMEKSF